MIVCAHELQKPTLLTPSLLLGMAYFFVLKSQNSFDVRWCKGNIGELIFDPWVKHLTELGVKFETSTRVEGFEMSSDDNNNISRVLCKRKLEDSTFESEALDVDKVVFAVGGAALNGMVRNSPELSRFGEFRRFANLRGTGVLATRLYLDTTLDTPYSANACFGFVDKGIGMTIFDITKLHGIDIDGSEVSGSIIEIDFYHAASLLVMSDEEIVKKVKIDLDTILGKQSVDASVLDAAIVRLP